MVSGKIKTAMFFLNLILICGYAFPADATTLVPTVTLVPSVFGSIEDSPPDGVGDTIVTFVPGVIDNVPSPPAPIARVDSAIVEYDLGSFLGVQLSTAFLDGTVFANNFLDTGDRFIDILLFEGDGVLSTSDFQIPATSVGTVSYRPPLDRSVSFNLNVKSLVQPIIDGGNGFIGFRFAALNEQAPSQLSAFDPPTLELSAVPEPSTILLIGTGLTSLVGFRRKFRT